MINKDNLKFFNNPDEAEDWIWRIKNGVIAWVGEHGKGFWYMVHWEGKRSGVLIKGMSRDDFATLLIGECSESLPPGETKTTLFHSIEKFKYKQQLQDFDRQKETSHVRRYEKELSELLTRDVEADANVNDFTLETRMKEYLTARIAKEPYARVCIRPQYGGKTATMSVENYVSKRFLDECRPSRIVIFECIDEKVTVEKVEMMHGRFGSLKNTKLFIASVHSFSSYVKTEADRYQIGLVLVNPDKPITENCFVMPRTQVGQQSEELTWCNMLVGKEKMSMPILVYDQGRIDDSLSFILYKHAKFDKKNLFAKAPYLYNDDIESIAHGLIKQQEEQIMSKLRQCGPQDKVPKCEIDPYEIGDEMGLSMERGQTGKELGLIDIGHNKITLSNQLKTDDPSDRFSMAHEIGHSIFHRRLSDTVKDGIHTIVLHTKMSVEHQANHFASCLLMPVRVISMLYAIYWKKEFKSEDVAPLQINGVYYNDPRFQRVVCPVARKMNVSPQAAYIRLKQIGLLFETT